MARPYSFDLRERVLAFVTSGQTVRAASTTFGVSVASAVNWTQRLRATGSAAAKPMGGKRPFLLEAERDWLLARLDEKPDLTLHALRDELRDRGITVSCDTLWRFLKRQEISFKKKLCSPPNRIAQTSPGGASAGKSTKPGLIRRGLSLSMRPGQKP